MAGGVKYSRAVVPASTSYTESEEVLRNIQMKWYKFRRSVETFDELKAGILCFFEPEISEPVSCFLNFLQQNYVHFHLKNDDTKCKKFATCIIEMSRLFGLMNGAQIPGIVQNIEITNVFNHFTLISGPTLNEKINLKETGNIMTGPREPLSERLQKNQNNPGDHEEKPLARSFSTSSMKSNNLDKMNQQDLSEKSFTEDTNQEGQVVKTKNGVQVVLPKDITILKRLPLKVRKKLKKKHVEYLIRVQDDLPEYIIDSYPGTVTEKVFIGVTPGNKEAAWEYLLGKCADNREGSRVDLEPELFVLETREPPKCVDSWF